MAALVFCSLVAKAEIVLCFLSVVNVNGRFSCFCKKSGMWSSQCHFFINGTPKSASWKLWMAFSAAASKLALVVAPHMVPWCTWSKSMAWARKAEVMPHDWVQGQQVAGRRTSGLTGASSPSWWKTSLLGGLLSKPLPPTANGLHGLEEDHWSSALQDPMHPIVAELAHWSDLAFGQQCLVQKEGMGFHVQPVA